MGNNNTTYSDKEIYDALKMIKGICVSSGSCRNCKLSYTKTSHHLCGVDVTPNMWNFTDLPGEWKPFEKEETHGYK